MKMKKLLKFLGCGVIMSNGFLEKRIPKMPPTTKLLMKGGLYKRLWDAQVGEFLGDEEMEDEA
jgi:hypothetical protein